MAKQDIIRKMIESKVVAVIPATTKDETVGAAGAAIDGGVRVIEISMGTHGALTSVEEVIGLFAEKAVIGAGSITFPFQAREALLRGCSFVNSPILQLDMVSVCQEFDRVAIIGGMTPSEIAAALASGADFINVFPTDLLGGPRYLTQILEVLPGLPILASGGISFASVNDYLDAGAKLVAVGSSLIPGALVQAKDFDALAHHVHRFLHALSGPRAA